MIVIIRTDATRIHIDRDCPPATGDLCEWIGCEQVTILPLSATFDEACGETQVVVDEDGFLRDKPINPVASVITGLLMAGDVVLLSAGNMLE